MYDTIIIGAGPAGMTSAIYLARANKKALIIEKETIGGQISSSPLVENYPGFAKISGSEFSDNLYNQVTDLGVSLEVNEVTEITNKDDKFIVKTSNNSFESKTVIIATGCIYRRLGLPNENELIGRGIHYCVSCDGAFYKNRVVAVIGGANSAIISAISLATLCKKVYLIHHNKNLRSEPINIDKLKSIDNVEILYDKEVISLMGEEKLEGIVLKDTISNKEEKLIVDGIFPAIGTIPQTSFLNDLLKLDDKNYILSNDCLTSIKGLFVAGDCRDKKVRQLTTATSDGTIAAVEAINYLNQK